jgi:RNA polymerase sigma factor (sigma-70 family)
VQVAELLEELGRPPVLLHGGVEATVGGVKQTGFVVRREPAGVVPRVTVMELSTAEPVTPAAGCVGDAAVEPFEAFYRAHLDRVYRALAVTLSNSDLAREATDEAMARAYVQWGRLRSFDDPAGWVYRVGLNWATSWWRKTRREKPPFGDEPTAVPAPDAAGLAARAALDRLPVAQRAVVVCRVLLDLSTADTAATLRISEGTVKSRLSRALTGLRTALIEEEPNV